MQRRILDEAGGGDEEHRPRADARKVTEAINKLMQKDEAFNRLMQEHKAKEENPDD